MIFQKKYIMLAIIFFGLIPPSIEAWDVTGHDIIAQIAYNHLSNTARNNVDYLINRTNFCTNFPSFSPYVYSAPWPDHFKHSVEDSDPTTKDVFIFFRELSGQWHYTDRPIVIGNYKPAQESNANSIWAVNYLSLQLSRLVADKK